MTSVERRARGARPEDCEPCGHCRECLEDKRARAAAPKYREALKRALHQVNQLAADADAEAILAQADGDYTRAGRLRDDAAKARRVATRIMPMTVVRR